MRFRNYLLITPKTDLDFSVDVSYAHYPMETQDDEFRVNLTEESISGSLSTRFSLTPFVTGTLRDDILYQTDYVDTRGMEDVYGGNAYEHFRNKLALNIDWLMSQRQNLGLTISRDDLIPQDDEFESQEKIAWTESLIYEHKLVRSVVAGCGARYEQIEYADDSRVDVTRDNYFCFARFTKDAKAGMPVTGSSSLKFTLGYSGGYSWSDSTTATNETENGEGGAVGSLELTTHMSKHMSQALGYKRGVRVGFTSAFESHDTAFYRLDYAPPTPRWTAHFKSTLSEVDPSNSSENDYSSWTTSLKITVPLALFARAHLSSSYTTRDNTGNPPAGADEEWAHDYATWVSSIGTGFAVTPSIKFQTSLQHIERISDSESLAYERDIFNAAFIYTLHF